jgi:hypothetical protein
MVPQFCRLRPKSGAARLICTVPSSSTSIFTPVRAEKLAEQLNDFVGLGERRSGGQGPA